MPASNITIAKIIELKGGSLEELRLYSQSKGFDLPNNLNYSLTPTELKAIDPILASKTLTINEFTDKDCIYNLCTNPSLCRYITDANLLHQWIDTYITTKRSLDELQAFSKVYDFLSHELVVFAKEKVESIADIKIQELYASLSKNTNIDENEIVLAKHSYRKTYDYVKATPIKSLHYYLRLTTKDHEEDKEKCIQTLCYNKFKLAATAFISNPLKHNVLEDLISCYNALRDERKKNQDELTHTLLNAIEKSTKGNNSGVAVYLLTKVTSFEGYEKWISLEESLTKVSEIVEQWKYQDLADYIKIDAFFDNAYGFYDIIVKKALSLIERNDVSKPFGCQTYSTNKDIYIQQENCSFLNNLKLYISHSSDSTKTAWENYIKSKNIEETLILYKYNVISDLPEYIIAKIVNDIILDSVYVNNDRWYYKPVLKDKDTEQILASTDIDLFPIISARLATMIFSKENIPLAVLLTEIMTINRPQNNYYSQNTWDKDFENKLREFRSSNIDNLELGIILWAIHSKTPASVTGLKEIFALLPPYLQIRSVKKLFQLISQGKLQYTAESLYNTISGTDTPICFPLEITFAYLKLREKEPSKTLDNNIMLSLLDGRDDHPEWIGIRQLITQCHGRWQVKKNDNNRRHYFNGIIKNGQDNNLELYIPRQMIDNNENLQNYNNKHFGDIQELIKITYDATEYCDSHVSNGVIYRFNKSHELDLFAVARTFNLKYAELDRLGFENIEAQDDVFCECRAAKALDNRFGISFYWCGNKPCFRQPIRYMVDSEWENYTILDFMRILHIPTDYINQKGKITRFGHYILLSAYLKSFAKFYEHLKCRECGNLMKPLGLTNFSSRAVNKFQCVDRKCHGFEKIIYLNHCFNKQRCNATIDSRDSKHCPNGQCICPECGACCSTENFRRRLEHLRMTGGDIPMGLIHFIQHNMGHWERQEYFCYRCGEPMRQAEGNGLYVCSNCKNKIQP